MNPGTATLELQVLMRLVAQRLYTMLQVDLRERAKYLKNNLAQHLPAKHVGVTSELDVLEARSTIIP